MPQVTNSPVVAQPLFVIQPAVVGAPRTRVARPYTLLGGSTPATFSPVITIVTSLPPATANTPVVVTITGGSGVPIRRAWIDAVLPGIIGTEVIHNGNTFGAFYTNGTNTRVSILNGYQYTILRDGGWPVGSFPLTTSFDISAVDTVGNGT